MDGSVIATDIFNIFMPTNLILNMMTFLKIDSIQNNQSQINFEEVGEVFRAIFGLCFYRCSVAYVQDKQQCYPFILAAIERLKGSSTRSKF